MDSPTELRYSWFLNNIGLNCAGSLTMQIFFSNKHTVSIMGCDAADSMGDMVDRNGRGYHCCDRNPMNLVISTRALTNWAKQRLFGNGPERNLGIWGELRGWGQIGQPRGRRQETLAPSKSVLHTYRHVSTLAGTSRTANSSSACFLLDPTTFPFLFYFSTLLCFWS